MSQQKVLAASGVILKDKKILLIKRSNYTKIFPACWACPGGRAELGETAKQNVIREVKEEVNLDFKPTEILTTATWQNRFLYRFLGTWSGHIKLQEEEVTDFDWFTFDAAQKLELAFDYPKVLELLRDRDLLNK
ncbi:MAG: NUDIX hydrolase [Flavobacteriaceae bacterium]|nr:NUDIX hydrolase [Flavobacteriaceae bacterium]